MEPVFSHSIAAKWTSSSGQLVVSPPWVPAKASNQPRSVQIDSVTSVDELNIPPGNRLEALKGDRAGLHSIRISNQWRICFRWESDGVYDVEIVDYH